MGCPHRRCTAHPPCTRRRPPPHPANRRARAPSTASGRPGVRAAPLSRRRRHARDGRGGRGGEPRLGPAGGPTGATGGRCWSETPHRRCNVCAAGTRAAGAGAPTKRRGARTAGDGCPSHPPRRPPARGPCRDRGHNLRPPPRTRRHPQLTVWWSSMIGARPLSFFFRLGDAVPHPPFLLSATRHWANPGPSRPPGVSPASHPSSPPLSPPSPARPCQ